MVCVARDFLAEAFYLMFTLRTSPVQWGWSLPSRARAGDSSQEIQVWPGGGPESPVRLCPQVASQPFRELPEAVFPRRKFSAQAQKDMNTHYNRVQDRERTTSCFISELVPLQKMSTKSPSFGGGAGGSVPAHKRGTAACRSEAARTLSADGTGPNATQSESARAAHKAPRQRAARCIAPYVLNPHREQFPRERPELSLTLPLPLSAGLLGRSSRAQHGGADVCFLAAGLPGQQTGSPTPGQGFEPPCCAGNAGIPRLW